CPVMSSRCLSAGSLRFLVAPRPTGDFGLPYGQLTRGLHWLARETPLGVSCSTPIRYNLGGSPSLLPGCLVSLGPGISAGPLVRGEYRSSHLVSRSSSSLSTIFR